MSKIDLKSSEEIALMSEGGRRLSNILTEVLGKIQPGLSTLKVDTWIEEGILKAGGKPSFKTVANYRYSSCVGLNHEVVHSIPRADKIINKGDLLKIDLGMNWKGFHTDLAWTIEVGGQDQNRDFLKAGKKALSKAIAVCQKGKRVGNISLEIQKTIESSGYNPVRVLTGHGIGGKLHEDPLIPCILRGKIENSPLIKEGMTLAIEVIYAQKSPEVTVEHDGWTICTKDGKISALFEETIAVTENGPLVLTPMDF